MTVEFLEYLEQLLGCQYLSDLPYASADDGQLQKVRGIPTGRFAKKELTEGAAYITGERRDFASEQEALEAIAARLENNR